MIIYKILNSHGNIHVGLIDAKWKNIIKHDVTLMHELCLLDMSQQYYSQELVEYMYGTTI